MKLCQRGIPVFPPRTESATPAPLGKAMSTPTQRRLTSPRLFISDVGKLVECPHLVSENVVNNLEEKSAYSINQTFLEDDYTQEQIPKPDK